MHISAFIPYASLFFGVVLYFLGSIVWDYGAGADDDHQRGGTERDIKMGMIGAITGLLIIALSLCGIGVHIYELYKYYLG